MLWLTVALGVPRPSLRASSASRSVEALEPRLDSLERLEESTFEHAIVPAHAADGADALVPGALPNNFSALERRIDIEPAMKKLADGVGKCIEPTPKVHKSCVLAGLKAVSNEGMDLGDSSSTVPTDPDALKKFLGTVSVEAAALIEPCIEDYMSPPAKLIWPPSVHRIVGVGDTVKVSPLGVETMGGFTMTECAMTSSTYSEYFWGKLFTWKTFNKNYEACKGAVKSGPGDEKSYFTTAHPVTHTIAGVEYECVNRNEFNAKRFDAKKFKPYKISADNFKDTTKKNLLVLPLAKPSSASIGALKVSKFFNAKNKLTFTKRAKEKALAVANKNVAMFATRCLNGASMCHGSATKYKALCFFNPFLSEYLSGDKTLVSQMNLKYVEEPGPVNKLLNQRLEQKLHGEEHKTTPYVKPRGTDGEHVFNDGDKVVIYRAKDSDDDVNMPVMQMTHLKTGKSVSIDVSTSAERPSESRHPWTGGQSAFTTLDPRKTTTSPPGDASQALGYLFKSESETEMTHVYGFACGNKKVTCVKAFATFDEAVETVSNGGVAKLKKVLGDGREATKACVVPSTAPKSFGDGQKWALFEDKDEGAKKLERAYNSDADPPAMVAPPVTPQSRIVLKDGSALTCFYNVAVMVMHPDKADPKTWTLKIGKDYYPNRHKVQNYFDKVLTFKKTGSGAAFSDAGWRMNGTWSLMYNNSGSETEVPLPTGKALGAETSFLTFKQAEPLRFRVKADSGKILFRLPLEPTEFPAVVCADNDDEACQSASEGLLQSLGTFAISLDDIDFNSGAWKQDTEGNTKNHFEMLRHGMSVSSCGRAKKSKVTNPKVIKSLAKADCRKKRNEKVFNTVCEQGMKARKTGFILKYGREIKKSWCVSHCDTDGYKKCKTDKQNECETKYVNKFTAIKNLRESATCKAAVARAYDKGALPFYQGETPGFSHYIKFPLKKGKGRDDIKGMKQLVQKLVDLKVMTQAEADHENAWQYMLPGAHPQMFKGTGQLDTTKAAVPSHKGSDEEEAAIEQKAKDEQVTRDRMVFKKLYEERMRDGTTPELNRVPTIHPSEGPQILQAPVRGPKDKEKLKPTEGKRYPLLMPFFDWKGIDFPGQVVVRIPCEYVGDENEERTGGGDYPPNCHDLRQLLQIHGKKPNPNRDRHFAMALATVDGLSTLTNNVAGVANGIVAAEDMDDNGNVEGSLGLEQGECPEDDENCDPEALANAKLVQGDTESVKDRWEDWKGDLGAISESTEAVFGDLGGGEAMTVALEAVCCGLAIGAAVGSFGVSSPAVVMACLPGATRAVKGMISVIRWATSKIEKMEPPSFLAELGFARQYFDELLVVQRQMVLTGKKPSPLLAGVVDQTKCIITSMKSYSTMFITRSNTQDGTVDKTKKQEGEDAAKSVLAQTLVRANQVLATESMKMALESELHLEAIGAKLGTPVIDRGRPLDESIGKISTKIDSLEKHWKDYNIDD